MKIALFRSLFRGREELYPRRFESRKSGRAGYSPACSNEWVRGICEKPKIKCSDCLHRRFLPLTDQVVHWHLSGYDNLGNDFVMGIYPMLLDEACFFLAVDFDKLSWEEDSLAFLQSCHQFHLPAALERSRSGKGAHVWLFFKEALPAILARKLGCHLLTETMERWPDIGLNSYDRLFPNQDTLPQGGFGNLIALPLQKKAREVGNSLFVDEQFTPYQDQWAFLSQLSKVGRCEVEALVHRAEEKGRIVGTHFKVIEEDELIPWNRQPSLSRSFSPLLVDAPEALKIVVGNEIYIPKKGLSPSLMNRLIRLAAFPNPEFYRAQAMRLSTHDKPRMIKCAEEYPNHIGLPRGCLDVRRQLGLPHSDNYLCR